jgi:hypothetical protein
MLAAFLLLLSGALLINAIPHLAAGLMGMPFPSPFAKPRGRGDSPPGTNFLWGFANLALGLGLLVNNYAKVRPDGAPFVLGLGALVMGLYVANHFGKVRKDK